MKPEPYELDELISRLEDIAENEDGSLNYPKALYTLATRIRESDKLNNIRCQDDHKMNMALGNMNLEILEIVKKNRELILHSLECIGRIIGIITQISSEVSSEIS